MYQRKRERKSRSGDVFLQKSKKNPLVVTTDIIGHTLGHGLAVDALVGPLDHLKLRALVADECSNKLSVSSADTVNTLLDAIGIVHIRGSEESNHGVLKVTTGLALDSMDHALGVGTTISLVDEHQLRVAVAGQHGDVGALVCAKPALTSTIENLCIAGSADRVDHVRKRAGNVEKSTEHLLVVATGLRLDGRVERLAVLALIGSSSSRKLVRELGHEVDEELVPGASAGHGLMEALSKELVTGLHELQKDTTIVAAGLCLEILEEVTANSAGVSGNDHHALLTGAMTNDVNEGAVVGAEALHCGTETLGVINRVISCHHHCCRITWSVRVT